MKSSILLRCVARLCLALVLLTGLVPAQGLVLCVEADGCLSFELKAPDSGCGGCEGHAEDLAAPQAARPASVGLDCPCIDLAVRGNEAGKLTRSRPVELLLDGWIAPLPVVGVQLSLGSVCALQSAPRATPRVADGLAHLCSVILQV